MRVGVRLFARVRELAGSDCCSIELPNNSTVFEVRLALKSLFPVAASLIDRSALAVNGEYADNNRVVTAADELAVIPPVSGGSIE